MKSIPAACATLGLVVLVTAVGATANTAPNTEPCRKHAATQVALENCAAAGERASQMRVDAAYAALEKVVRGAELRSVRADERAWLTYRKLNCASASGLGAPGSGTIATFVALTCLTVRNKQRAAYLQWRADPQRRNSQPMP